MTPRRVIVMLVVLPLAAAALGLGAGPFMARANRVVQLAARVAREDALSLKERTLESEAFRDTGEPVADLYASARVVQRQFLIGGALLGAWCGLVVALKVAAQAVRDPVDVYNIDHARCLACARCFLSCPREHLRRRKAKSHPGSEKGRVAEEGTRG